MDEDTAEKPKHLLVFPESLFCILRKLGGDDFGLFGLESAGASVIPLGGG